MKYAREILFFSVIAIFLATAAVTLLGEARTMTAKDASRGDKGRLASEVFSGWKV